MWEYSPLASPSYAYDLNSPFCFHCFTRTFILLFYFLVYTGICARHVQQGKKLLICIKSHIGSHNGQLATLRFVPCVGPIDVKIGQIKQLGRTLCKCMSYVGGVTKTSNDDMWRQQVTQETLCCRQLLAPAGCVSLQAQHRVLHHPDLRAFLPHCRHLLGLLLA